MGSLNSPPHKNIVQIIADDLGLMLNCYGLASISTPNINALASQGTRFTKAFASTASCSGSRSTIYTGLHTHQNGQYGLNHGWNHFQTHNHIETAPAIFNEAGYLTGIVGKVHVGPRSVYPWTWFEESDSRDVCENANTTARFFDEAERSGRAFHLTVGFRDPHRDATRGGFGNEEDDVKHIPVPAYHEKDVETPEFLTDVPELRTELVEYYKSISRLDHGVGLIMEELRKRGLDENTLVIFMSDNGSPFLNSKTTLYDAGIRLPLIVRHPRGEKGVVNPNMVSFLDILPTCIDWAGFNPSNTATKSTNTNSPERLGTSFLPILSSSVQLPETAWKQHVFGSHTFHEIQNYWPTRFMRTHRYKYHRNIAWQLMFPFGTDLYGSLSWEGIRNSAAAPALPESDTPEVMLGRRRLASYLYRGPEELFDLENDPEEIHNLVGDEVYGEVVQAMRAELEEWQLETDDVWLFKDGVSAVVSGGYQKLGLKLPDRLDFDVERPGNKGVKCWEGNGKKTNGLNTRLG